MHTSSKTACKDVYLCCIFPYGARHRIEILFPLHRSCAAASFGIHAQKHASNPEVRNDRRFAVGDYKRILNEVADRETTIPENAPREIALLLDSYDPKAPHTLEQITDFHVQLGRIHPFQDGNGRVGRLVMLKECLSSNIIPFVISDEMKLFYYRDLSEWDTERSFFIDTSLHAQDRFKQWMEYFRIPYDE